MPNPLLRALGAARIISLDASSYEGASRVADLNAEIAPDLENAFTTVLDSGSLEHIFDFRAAIANCMRMFRLVATCSSLLPPTTWPVTAFISSVPNCSIVSCLNRTAS